MLEARDPSRKERAVLEHLQAFGARMQLEESQMLGYPINLSDDSSLSLLQPFHHLHINNVGDPTEDSSTFHMHAHDFERDVLEWFSRLWCMEDESEPWGYVTSGGTEGNIFGVYLGRELLPDAILYSSDQAHYSVAKAARLCKIHMEIVKSLPSGEIDYADLGSRLEINRGRPAVIVLNVGTTMRGAVDDIDRVAEVLSGKSYGADDFYIHCDAALSGMLLPFVKPGLIGFHKSIGSMSVSGHKFLGTTSPCGIVMTRKHFVDAISKPVEYIGMHDNTLSGSRNGLATVALWVVIASLGMSGIRARVEQCYRNAKMLKDLLQHGGWPNVNLEELSTTVTFKSPSDNALIKKWSLACEGGISHVVVMPHCDIEKLKAFASEMMQSLFFNAHPEHDKARVAAWESPLDLQPEHCTIRQRARCNILLMDDLEDACEASPQQNGVRYSRCAAENQKDGGPLTIQRKDSQLSMLVVEAVNAMLLSL